MKISEGKVAEIEYTMRLDDGEICDSTDGKPMPYLHGAGEIIPGLETALLGRSAGETLKLEFAPVDAFGEIDPEMTDELPLDTFPEDADLQVGDEVMFETEEGEEVLGEVTELLDDAVAVDFNHPFAGERIHIEVKVVSVRDATAEEREQGYVEDPYADDECDHDHDHEHDDPGHLH